MQHIEQHKNAAQSVCVWNIIFTCIRNANHLLSILQNVQSHYLWVKRHFVDKARRHPRVRPICV